MSAELVIVGAGPAGVSGALWARTLGISVRLIERAAVVGGQLREVHFHPAELPGIAAGSGPEIADTYAAQLTAAAIEPECNLEAVGLESEDHGVSVRLAGGTQIAGRSVLVATGLRRRRLGVPGEAELLGAGVSYSGRRDRDALAGNDVVVVGGGDGAFENALLLSAVGCRVLIVVRERALARPEFRERVAANPGIEVVEQARVIEISGSGRVEAVRIELEGSIATRPARGVVIKIGMTPNTEWCPMLERDAAGYLEVDGRGRTSLPWVWAAGDVVRPLLPSVAVAVGSAATALAAARQALRGR